MRDRSTRRRVLWVALVVVLVVGAVAGIQILDNQFRTEPVQEPQAVDLDGEPAEFTRTALDNLNRESHRARLYRAEVPHNAGWDTPPRSQEQLQMIVWLDNPDREAKLEFQPGEDPIIRWYSLDGSWEQTDDGIEYYSPMERSRLLRAITTGYEFGDAEARVVREDADSVTVEIDKDILPPVGPGATRVVISKSTGRVLEIHEHARREDDIRYSYYVFDRYQNATVEPPYDATYPPRAYFWDLVYGPLTRLFN